MQFAIVLSAVVAVALSFSTGAPESTCGDMMPRHLGTPAQTSASPYSINLSRRCIAPMARINVTLSAKPGDSFKGFFIQARVGNTPIGKFEPADGVKLVNCGSGVNTGATHLTPVARKKVTVLWEAPPSLTESVIFSVTTARDITTFWVAQKSSLLTVKK